MPDCRYPQGVSPAGGAGRFEAQSTALGSTQVFWAYAQGFFAGYYRLSATCQDLSAHAYYFTEDAYINDLSASSVNADTIYAAAKGGVYRSLDGDSSWTVFVAGLPTATGTVGTLDSADYNHRCLVNCLFSRAEYGETFDTVWVGTEYGPFWRSPALGDTFELRASLMPTDPDGFKPPTFDILGHPIVTETLWAGTEDGVYMTRNAKNWKHVSGGLPPSEGAIWSSAPAYALAYDPDLNLLFTVTSKGAFYGAPRPLGTSATADVVVSWKPLGGEVAVSLDTLFAANADTLRLLVADSSSKGLTISAGQSIAVIDTTTGLYWSAFVDASSQGLYALLVDEGIFYWPSGATAPVVNYSQIDSTNLIAYAYSQISGNAIYAQMQGDTTTVWLGSSAGAIAYQFIGDISERYSSDQESISSSHDSLAIYKIAEKSGSYYLATNQGLFKTSDLGGDWQLKTDLIGNAQGLDSVAVDVRTVAFGPGDKVYTGGYLGGFLRSDDGSTFVPSNLGMMHRNGTPQQIQLFADQFESSTPADPSKGIFETVQEWWGQLPDSNSSSDVDGDPRVAILFLDIDDQYYLSTGDGTYISGYYDGENEYSLLVFLNSNVREMFYLDTDPQWINNAGAAACNQTFNLINYNQDFEEEVWLREGMASFSQWVAGYPLSAGTMTFPAQDDLTAWGDKDRDTEHLYSYLLVLYLYEQLFPDSTAGSQVIHTLSQVATSPYHGVSGLGRLIYEKTIGPSSDAVDYTPVFGGIFNDFCMAGMLDITDPTFYDGKYGFQHATVTMGATSYNWYWPLAIPTSLPPFSWQIPFWSARAVQIQDTLFFNNAHPIDTLEVNGDDRNRLDFNFVFSFTGKFLPGLTPEDVAIVPVNADSVKKKGEVVFPPDLRMGNGNTPPNVVRLLTVCTSDSGEAFSCYVLDDDAQPPAYLYQTVAQNPIDDRYLDIYSFTDEHVYPDGGQLYRVQVIGLTDLEGPLVDISGAVASASGNDTTITLDQNSFFVNEAASAFVYHIAYHMEGIDFPAQLNFATFGEDAAGNEKSSDTLSVVADFVPSQIGGYLCDDASDANVSIPAGALPRDAYVALSVSQTPPDLPPTAGGRSIAAPLDDSHYAVGSLVSAGCSGLDLNAPIEIAVPYDPALAGSDEVGVYRAEGSGWIYIGGVADAQAGLIKSYSWKFGRFQAMAGPLGDITPEMPFSFRLDQNYPNPFNPATRVQFELGRSQKVKLEIYNLLGMRVAQLASGVLPAGRHSLVWSPGRLATGVYFLRLQADEGTLYRKMLFLK